MNHHAEETSDGWVDCALTLVVSGIRLAAHSAGAVDLFVAAIDAEPEVCRESGAETTDQLRTTAPELSAPQRSTMNTSDKWLALDNHGGPDLGVKGSRVQISPARRSELSNGTAAASR
jgi:hypothetical protein